MQLIQNKQKPVEECIERAFKTITNALLKCKEVLLTKIPTIKTELKTQGEDFKMFHNEIAETCDLITAATQLYTPAEILSSKDAMTNKVAQMLQQYRKYNLDLCRSDLVADMLDTAELIKRIGNFGAIIGSCHPDKAQTDIYFHGAVAGKEKKVTISTYDVDSKPYTHGGEIVETKLSSLGSNDLTVIATVGDNNSRKYVASFTPQEMGEHLLSVTIDSLPIKGSPFPMYVRKDRDYKTFSSCKLSLSVPSSAYDVAVDYDSSIYVAAYGYHCITVFSQTGKQMRTIGKAGSAGKGNGQFNSPIAIVIEGNILFVVDSANNRVQKLTTLGEFIAKFGTYRAGDGQLNQPKGISIHNDGRIFVSDCGNQRISVFNTKGTFLYHIAGNSANDNSFITPWGLAFDHQGNLHVTDSSNCFVKVFSSRGEFVTQYGGNQVISQPAGIAIDDKGTIFIAQMGGRFSLSVLNSEHQLIHSLQHGQSNLGIAIDKDGSIYTCGNNYVHKY